MRKLPPLKAVLHALNSVYSYARMGIRFGVFWIPLLFVLNLAEWSLLPPDPAAQLTGGALALQSMSAALGLVGFCSIAVSWHRFILRDEAGSPARIDNNVWRYVGNSLLIMMMILAPVLAFALALTVLPPIASVLLLPAVVLAGTAATRLSIKLPAVALGRTDFAFRDAWAASEGNFWQISGVFMLNAALVLTAGLVFMLAVQATGGVSNTVVPIVGLILGAVFQLFYTLFNASVFTSLYGFFVEKRDF